MAQHDYDLANAGGAAFRSDLNDVLSAIVTHNSGAAEPTTTYPYMLWVDTTTGLFKMRNAADSAWISLPISITASNETPTAFATNGALAIKSSASVYLGYNATGWGITGRYAYSGDYLQICPASVSSLDTTKGLKINRSSGLVEVLQGLLVSGADLTLGAGRSLVFADATTQATAANRIIVHRAEKTDTFTLSSATFTDVTGLSVAFTPVSAASTFVVLMDLHAVSDAYYYCGHARLVRDSTPIYLGAAAGSRILASAGVPLASYLMNMNHPIMAIAYDAPASPSGLTYKVQICRTASGGTMYVNRSQDDDDDANHTRTASSLTVLEIA